MEKFFVFFTSPLSVHILLVVGSPKYQLPTACLCNKNAYAPRAIRSYILSLLQAGYQTCPPRTMIKDFADPLLSVQCLMVANSRVSVSQN